jgi:hypothetical protein
MLFCSSVNPISSALYLCSFTIPGSENMANTIPIPEPPGLPVLGNLLDIDFDLPLKSLCELAEKYGEKKFPRKFPLKEMC